MIHYPPSEITRIFNLDKLIDGFTRTYTSTAPHKLHLCDLLLEYFDDEQRMTKYYLVVGENAYAGYSDSDADLLRKFNDYLDMICDEETLNYIIIER